MEIEFILYVANQGKSKEFYQFVLGKEAVLDVPGMTEFLLDEKTKLGLMPESSINKILAGKTRNPSEGNGIPRCELYLKTDDLQFFYQNALKAGANIVSPPLPRDWGDLVAYVSDPDGHILAFAQKL